MLSVWDVCINIASVRSLNKMLPVWDVCITFCQCDLFIWNVSNVRCLYIFFCICEMLVYNVSSVKCLYKMLPVWYVSPPVKVFQEVFLLRAGRPEVYWKWRDPMFGYIKSFRSVWSSRCIGAKCFKLSQNMEQLGQFTILKGIIPNMLSSPISCRAVQWAMLRGEGHQNIVRRLWLCEGQL